MPDELPQIIASLPGCAEKTFPLTKNVTSPTLRNSYLHPELYDMLPSVIRISLTVAPFGRAAAVAVWAEVDS